MPLRRSNIALSGLVIRNELAAKPIERALVDLVTRLSHQFEIEMEVVERYQAQSQNLFRLNEMPNITTTEFPAGSANPKIGGSAIDQREGVSAGHCSSGCKRG